MAQALSQRRDLVEVYSKFHDFQRRSYTAQLLDQGRLDPRLRTERGRQAIAWERKSEQEKKRKHEAEHAIAKFSSLFASG